MKSSQALRCFVFVTLASIPAYAQIRLDWSTRYATSGLDYLSVAKVDSAGNVYAAGTQNGAPGFLDGTAIIGAWSPSGTQLWTRTFDAALGRTEFPAAIEFDGAGGLYVTGSASATLFGVHAGFLLRLDAAGAITWSIEQPVTANGAFGPWLVVDAQGRAIVSGGMAGSDDLSITAYTATGAVAWQSTYTSPLGGVGVVNDLAIAPNGEIVAIGTVNAMPGRLPVLIRLAPDGTLLQALEITAPEFQSGSGSAIAVDASGRIFAAIDGRPPGSSVSWLMLLGFDAQGAPQWLRSIPGVQQLFGGGSAATALEIDVFGRAVVLGGKAQGYAGVALVIAAYEANGNEAWRSISNDVFGGPSVNLWNFGSALLLDAGGEATVVGSHSTALSDVDADAFAFAVDSTGKKRFGVYAYPPGSGSNSPESAYGGARVDGQSFVVVGSALGTSAGTGSDAFVARFTRTASGFCFGDGAAVACPCGNASAPVERSGCASSLGVGGRLADLGASSLAADTLKLVGSSMPNSLAVYYQGTIAGAGTTFGDGLACVRGEVIRLGEAINVAGGSQFPATAGSTVSSIGQIASPGTRVYQAVYRNAASFCTDKAFNTTNGMLVTWTP